MPDRLDVLLGFLRRYLVEPLGRMGGAAVVALRTMLFAGWRARRRLIIAALLAVLAYGFYGHPPFATVRRSEVLVRTNVFDGAANAYSAGTVLVLPGIHQVRRYSTRDQVYRLLDSASATGKAPFQSNEGLSIGVDLAVRWAIDRARIAQMSKQFPDDLNVDLIAPAVQGIAYPLLAQYSVHDIFSGRRAAIQHEIAAALGPKLAAMGLLLRGVDMGQVDLPQDYRVQMEAPRGGNGTQKVRYTLQLKGAGEGDAAGGRGRQVGARGSGGCRRGTGHRRTRSGGDHAAHLPFKQKQIGSAGSRPKPKRSRVSAPLRAQLRRVVSRPGARRTLGKGSPTRKPTGSISSAGPAPARWNVRAYCSRITRC
jgi:regulator of protease activity HflC (stomatin/prohibitin superfamily)